MSFHAARLAEARPACLGNALGIRRSRYRRICIYKERVRCNRAVIGSPNGIRKLSQRFQPLPTVTNQPDL